MIWLRCMTSLRGFQGDTFQMKMTGQKTTNNKTQQIHGIEMLNQTLSPESVDKIHHF